MFGLSIPKLTEKVIDTAFTSICTSDVYIPEIHLIYEKQNTLLYSLNKS